MRILLLATALLCLSCMQRPNWAPAGQHFDPARFSMTRGASDPLDTTAFGDSLTFRFTPGDSLQASWPAELVPESVDGEGFWLQLRLYPARGWLASRPLWGLFAKPLPYRGHESVPDDAAAALDTAVVLEGSVAYSVVERASVAYLDGRYIVTVPMAGHTGARALYGWYEALTVGGCPDCQVIERSSRYNAVLDPAHTFSVVPE